MTILINNRDIINQDNTDNVILEAISKFSYVKMLLSNFTMSNVVLKLSMNIPIGRIDVVIIGDIANKPLENLIFLMNRNTYNNMFISERIDNELVNYLTGDEK